MDIGALTVFLYTFREREEILRIFEAAGRPADDDQLHSASAGLAWSRRWTSSTACRPSSRLLPEKIDEYANLLTGNPIFRTG